MKKLILTGLLCAAAGFSLCARVVYTDNEWQINRIMYAVDNNKPIPEPTAFRLRMTDAALVVDVKLEGDHWKKMQSVPFKAVTNVWPVSESVEIFLDPGRSCSKYVQVAAGMGGELFDNRFVKSAWNAKWTVKRSDFKGGSILSFTIPFDSEFKKPATGDVWGFNICRNVKNSTPYFSTFAKVGRYFNQPSKFAEMRVGTKKTFFSANQKKNLKQLELLKKEIVKNGFEAHFSVMIKTLEKDCDELAIQAMRDEFNLLKSMKEIK